MSRIRCAAPGRNPGGVPDPGWMAERWAELARHVTARADRAGVQPLVSPPVWAAAADPATWEPGPTGNPWVIAARILGGLPGEAGPTADDPGGYVDQFTGALIVWDPHRAGNLREVPVWLGRAVLGGALLAGLPPGTTPGDLGTGFTTLLEEAVRSETRTLGGVALEALGITVARAQPRDAVWRRARAVVDLLAGRCDQITVDHGDLLIRPRGWRRPVELTIGYLYSPDPRPGRRFLRIFHWEPWLDARSEPRWNARVVTGWLAAVAPADRAATRVLVEHRLWEEAYVGRCALFAVRAAGHPAGWAQPADDLPGHIRLDDAPVLWWRRVLSRLTTHPDRLRAVREAEDAWFRLCVDR